MAQKFQIGRTIRPRHRPEPALRGRLHARVQTAPRLRVIGLRQRQHPAELQGGHARRGRLQVRGVGVEEVVLAVDAADAVGDDAVGDHVAVAEEEAVAGIVVRAAEIGLALGVGGGCCYVEEKKHAEQVVVDKRFGH